MPLSNTAWQLFTAITWISYDFAYNQFKVEIKTRLWTFLRMKRNEIINKKWIHKFNWINSDGIKFDTFCFYPDIEYFCYAHKWSGSRYSSHFSNSHTYISKDRRNQKCERMKPKMWTNETRNVNECDWKIIKSKIEYHKFIDCLTYTWHGSGTQVYCLSVERKMSLNAKYAHSNGTMA